MMKKKNMKKRWHRMFTAILALALVFTFTPASIPAAEEQADNSLSVQTEASAEIMPAAVDNLVVSLREKSSLTVTSDGYMRVYYDGEQIGVEYYDSDFNIVSKTTIAMELSVWGGFYAGTDAYYIVEGQYNTDEDDDAEVIRVIKYSTEWERLGAASITSNPNLFGGEVRYPFDYGCVQFAEYDGTLYIVTGHEGYVDESVGQGHQGFLMIAVDESEMTGQIVKSDLWHSFAQYIDSDGSDLYVLEQSEGSRCTALSKIDADTLKTTEISVLDYGGTRTSAWAVSCYASVDGMALSSDNVLCVGTSIDQSQYDSVTSDTAHNIYLTVTPKSDFTEDATTVKWLTDFSGDGKSFVGLKITKVNDERFMISWEEYTGESADAAESNDALSGYILHYIFVDGEGNKISSEFTAAAPISECQPVLSGSDIVYFASSSNMVDFYKINTSSGEFSKKIYRVAGENATWDITDGVLTVSGSGTISVDTDVHYRYPLSSCLSGYVYYSNDNAWKPIRSSVEEVVIESGITVISEGSFKGFSNLTEVTLQSGIETIEDEAFASCSSLSKITIPDSVTSIGDDILWTGSYWTSDGSHVVKATIYCEEGSVAESYAKENGISYVIMSEAVIENNSIYGTSVSLSGIRLSNTDEGLEVTFDAIEGTVYYNITYQQTSYESTFVQQLNKANGDVSDDQETYTKIITDDIQDSGDIYTVYVKAYTSSGTVSTDTGTIMYLSQPVLSISGTGSDPTVAWEAVNGAESYQIYRRTDDSDWMALDTTTETAYTDASADLGIIYYYTVQAVSGFYRSSSDEAGVCTSQLEDAGSGGTGSDSTDSGSSETNVGLKADSLCVRRGNAYYFSYTIHAGNADKVIYYGRTADEVLVGDWDGDGVDTICVRRGNTYYFNNSLKSGNADEVVYYGRATDEVLVGDWNGDGKDTLAVRRGNTYYISNTIKSGNADKVVYYGKDTDTVLVGDWDGDGKDTLMVRRGNAYYVSNTIKSGNADKVVYYGRATDSVLVGDWDGDNVDTLAVRRGNIYYISNAIKSGNADKVVAYGKATDEVYTGRWK